MRDENSLVIWFFVMSLWSNTEKDKPVDITLFDFQSPQMQTRKTYLRKSEIPELWNKDICACSYIFNDRCKNSFAFLHIFASVSKPWNWILPWRCFIIVVMLFVSLFFLLFLCLYQTLIHIQDQSSLVKVPGWSVCYAVCHGMTGQPLNHRVGIRVKRRREEN